MEDIDKCRYDGIQKHLRWTILGPFSMNSVLLIHMAVKVARELRIEPPIQDKNFLSLGPTTLSLVPAGTRL